MWEGEGSIEKHKISLIKADLPTPFSATKHDTQLETNPPDLKTSPILQRP